jgi:hypothetical protein
MDDRSSQKWLAKVRSSTTSLHKNGFGLDFLQHNSALNLPPWLKEGMVYIDMGLVIISQLPPKIWPLFGMKSPFKWPNNPKKFPIWAKL